MFDLLIWFKIRDGRASGVEYTNDLTLNLTADRTVHVATATQFVVVSAGAFGSPAILERSGIGSSEVLARMNIPQVVDLPGIGENFLGQHYSQLLRRK